MCVFDSIHLEDTTLFPIQIGAIHRNWLSYYENLTNKEDVVSDILTVDIENNWLLFNIKHGYRRKGILAACDFFKHISYGACVPIKLQENVYLALGLPNQSIDYFLTADELLYFLETLTHLNIVPGNYKITGVMTGMTHQCFWNAKEEMLEWCQKAKTIVDKLPGIDIRFPFDMFSKQLSTLKKVVNNIDTTIEQIEKFVI